MSWFDGVFELVRYDNLTSAVKQVLKGRRRVESDRFVALRSHYLFESQFTRRASRVRTKRAASRARSAASAAAISSPCPAVGSLGELNALLRAGCEADLERDQRAAR